MSFPDITADLKTRLPKLRGRLLPNQSLAELTWFRVGGPAQIMFMPEDESDLGYFLANLPSDMPVTVIGLGSNLIVRDGGVPGVVIRLGRGFNEVSVDGTRIRAGAAVPDVKVARAAQEAGIGGLAFMRGIPGGVGGALRMNGGAYGRETKDALLEARAVDRKGNVHVLKNSDMGYTYRHCSVPADFIFTHALYQGEPGDSAIIAAAVVNIGTGNRRIAARVQINRYVLAACHRGFIIRNRHIKVAGFGSSFTILNHHTHRICPHRKSRSARRRRNHIGHQAPVHCRHRPGHSALGA